MKFKFLVDEEFSNAEDDRYIIVNFLDGHTDQIRNVILLNNRIITCSYDKTIKIFDYNPKLKTFVVSKTLDYHENFVVDLKVLPKKQRLISVSHDRSLVIYDLTNEKIVKPMKDIHEGKICSVFVNEEDNVMITGSWDNYCKVWSLDGEKRIELKHENTVLCVLQMPQSKDIITGSGDDKIYVWDGESGKQKKVISVHKACVRGLDFLKDEDGKVKGFISCSNDGYLKLFDLEYTETESIYAHINMILNVFTIGDLVCSSAEDRMVRVWKRKRNGEYALFQELEHSDAVWNSKVSGDGKLLVCVSQNSRGYVWMRKKDCQEPKEFLKKKKRLFKEDLVKEKQELEGIKLDNYQKYESEKDMYEKLKSEYLGEVQILNINGLVKVYQWNGKEWKFLSFYVDEIDPCKVENFEEDEGYESPREDVDLDYDDSENSKLKYIWRKKQNSLMLKKEIDFRCCNGCTKRLVDCFHCFECHGDMDLCKECYVPGKTVAEPNPTNNSYHLHDGEDYFHYVSCPRFQQWFDITLSGSCAQVITKCFKYYADRYCVAERNTTKEKFKWIKYSEIEKQVIDFSTGMMSIGIKEGDYIGILSRANMEYVVADLSCVYANLISVPIQRILTSDKKKHVIKSSKLNCVICSDEYLKELKEILKDGSDLPDLRRVVIFKTPHGKDTVVKNDKIGSVEFHTFDEVKGKGNSMKEKVSFNHEFKNDQKNIITIVHTSGTSSDPKGIVFRENQWLKYMFRECKLAPLSVLGFCPLSHNSGRLDFFMSFVNGGRFAFLTNSSMTNFFEDAVVLNPSIMSLVPRVMNSVYDLFKDNVNCRIAENVDERKIKTEEFLKLKKRGMFGNRICDISVGGAKCALKIKRFFRKLLDIPVYDTYGSTEVGLISFNYRFDEDRLKIVDCPELGYFKKDKPFPRGELCVKVTNEVEYFNYKEEEREEEEEGEDDEEDEKGEGEKKKKVKWYHTKDIVELRGNKIIVIDRKCNIVKLAQGEFVSLIRIENIILTNCKLVSQVMVYTNSFDLVALVVVDKSNNIVENIKEMVVKQINVAAQKSKLNNWEIPSNILVVTEEFTIENKQLTVTGKMNRRKIVEKYKPQLKKLFVRGESVVDTIMRILGSGDIDDSCSFLELGGDSLSAIRLINEFKRMGKEITLEELSKTPVKELSSLLKDLKGKNRSLYVSFKEEKQKMKELSKELKGKFKGKKVETVGGIFLTGGTGFLGRFILKDLLEQYDSNVKIYLLARSKNSLKKISHFYDEARVVPVFGDLSKERFGLERGNFEELSSKVDVIVHCGAMVNHFLPYYDHYKPNVRSVFDIVAMAGGYKPIYYVSSVSVYSSFPPKKEDDIEVGRHRRSDGYSTSKWVADCLFSKYVDNCTIFRPSLIFGSKEYGESNLKDWLNIIIKVMMKHKVAPSTNTMNHLDMIPVDYLSYVIVRASKLSVKKMIFNVSMKNVSVKDLVDSLISTHDKTIKRLKFDEWIQLVEEKEKENVKTSEILPFLNALRVNQMIGNEFIDMSGYDESALTFMNEKILSLEKFHLGKGIGYTKEELLRIFQFMFKSLN